MLLGYANLLGQLCLTQFVFDPVINDLFHNLELLFLKLVEFLKVGMLELFLQVLINAFRLHFGHPISFHLIFAFLFSPKKASVFGLQFPFHSLVSCQIF